MPLKHTFRTRMTPCAVISTLLLICCLACQKEGDPAKFTEIPIEEVTEKNVPKGLVVRDGEVRLAEGFEGVLSPDSTMALIVGSGGHGGNLAMRCDCEGATAIGCIVVVEGIFTCRALLCDRCKPVLQVYDGFLTKERFIAGK